LLASRPAADIRRIRVRKDDFMRKTVLVCGAGGFIGSHLIKRLKKDGYWVRGVDLKYPEFSPTPADEFLILDLKEQPNCERVVRTPEGRPFDEVYQLAADMGGMGFIQTAEHPHDQRRGNGRS
jgi:nucleoside-diphosphate-sugar epimerase